MGSEEGPHDPFDEAAHVPLTEGRITLRNGSLVEMGVERRHQRDRREFPGSTPSNSFRPQRKRNGNEVEITFYCARERLEEMMQYRHVFGDADFTRSLSRFLTAGCHWMGKHQAEVGAAQAMATEVRMLEQERDALQATIARIALPAPRPWWRRLLGI